MRPPVRSCDTRPLPVRSAIQHLLASFFDIHKSVGLCGEILDRGSPLKIRTRDADAEGDGLIVMIENRMAFQIDL